MDFWPPIGLFWKVRRSSVLAFHALEQGPTNSWKTTILTVHVAPDPKYEEEVSGCTASTAIISKHKIWVVRWKQKHREGNGSETN